jgi:hypothetical protein
MKFELLPQGEVKPRGWIEEQMRLDLHQGLKGNFPRITANVSQKLFAMQDRQPGTWVPGARGSQEKAWWAGEHEGYWFDGIVRSAILLDDAAFKETVQIWVDAVLGAFNKTGYIGIYDAETRFPAKGFDGELWTQSRAFQALLAWYEYSGDQRILDAVIETVRKTIDHYRAQGTYFGRPNPDGGVTHGVGYMDTLEWLYRLTRDSWFADAAVWFYTDYSNSIPETFDDLTAGRMVDLDFPWDDHGAHIGEALHLPRIAHAFSGEERFGKAATHVLPKLFRHTNPGGGVALGYLEAVACSEGGGHLPSENCAHIEALMSLNRLFQFEPDLSIADWQERCIFNVVQGARFHPVDKAVAYLSRDNRRHAADPKIHGGRELFSACHTAAACCVLNQARAMSYYVEGLWCRSTDKAGLLAKCYGPCALSTKIAGVAVRIQEITDYPFSDQIEFQIDPAEPVEFELCLRIPESAVNPVVEGSGAVIVREEGLIRISRVWKPGDVLTVTFDFNVERRIQHDGREAYWTRGSLVFSLPFEAEVKEELEINAESGMHSGFYEYRVQPLESSGWDYLTKPDSAFTLIHISGDRRHSWVAPSVAVEGLLMDRLGNDCPVRLVPLGSTILRRTTFPFSKYVPADPYGMDKVTGTGGGDDPMRFF